MEVRRSAVVLEVALTREDLRLIGLGLVGKLSSASAVDRAKAADLNERLLKARRRAVKEELTHIEGAISGPSDSEPPTNTSNPSKGTE